MLFSFILHTIPQRALFSIFIFIAFIFRSFLLHFDLLPLKIKADGDHFFALRQVDDVYNRMACNESAFNTAVFGRHFKKKHSLSVQINFSVSSILNCLLKCQCSAHHSHHLMLQWKNEKTTSSSVSCIVNVGNHHCDYEKGKHWEHHSFLSIDVIAMHVICTLLSIFPHLSAAVISFSLWTNYTNIYFQYLWFSSIYCG